MCPVGKSEPNQEIIEKIKSFYMTSSLMKKKRKAELLEVVVLQSPPHWHDADEEEETRGEEFVSGELNSRFKIARRM
jgi:hypothetical protein